MCVGGMIRLAGAGYGGWGGGEDMEQRDAALQVAPRFE